MKKKLLFINGHLNTGGVEKSLLDTLTHLDYEKFDVDLLLLQGTGDYEKQLPEQVHVLDRNIEHTYGSVLSSIKTCIRQHDVMCLKLRLIFLLMKFFGQQKITLAGKVLLGKHYYDAVIGYRTGICTQLAAFAVNADHRFTWWHHGLFNVDEAEYREQVLQCDRAVVVSESCRQMLLEHYPDLESHFTVIPNMVDETALKRQAEQSDPYKHDRLNIVSVGRLAEEKHFCNVVYAAAKLKAAGVQFCWHVVGEGAERADLEKRISDQQVSDVVILEGNQVNPYPYMKCADLFVHPSYYESQGLVVVEALTLGVPVVATKSGGVCEFLTDGVNAVLTEQSEQALFEVVDRVIRDDRLFTQLKAESKCPAQFQAAAISAEIEALLMKAL